MLCRAFAGCSDAGPFRQSSLVSASCSRLGLAVQAEMDVFPLLDSETCEGSKRPRSTTSTSSDQGWFERPVVLPVQPKQLVERGRGSGVFKGPGSLSTSYGCRWSR